jgi:LysM repeat protein
MKFKILLITLTLFTTSFSVFANTLIDSVGVKNNDGKKMVLFKVKAKDTYYSIGRRYNIKPEVLMKFNGKKKAILSIGTIVEVPTDQPFKKSGKAKETEQAATETKKEKKERLAKEEEQQDTNAKKHKHKESSEDNVPIVQQQRVPDETPQQSPQPVAQAPQPEQNNSPTMQYKVSAHETLYSIAKRFNTTVDDITKLNNLSSTNLTPGEILMVRSGAATQQPQQSPQEQQTQQQQPQTQQQMQRPTAHNDTPIAKRDSTLVAAPLKDSSNADHHLNANRFGLYEKNEKGVATWIDDTSLDPNKKLVLHRTAPIGTVIKITNPMTNRTTFAKVVGRFTDNEATKDVIIVMTKNVADSLGALDKRFHVNISYGSPNE